MTHIIMRQIKDSITVEKRILNNWMVHTQKIIISDFWTDYLFPDIRDVNDRINKFFQIKNIRYQAFGPLKPVEQTYF